MAIYGKGMDVARTRASAASFRGRVAECRETAMSVEDVRRRLPSAWGGADARRFDATAGRTTRALADVAVTLERMAERIESNIAAQEAASRGTGATVFHGVPTPRPEPPAAPGPTQRPSPAPGPSPVPPPEGTSPGGGPGSGSSPAPAPPTGPAPAPPAPAPSPTEGPAHVPAPRPKTRYEYLKEWWERQKQRQRHQG